MLISKLVKSTYHSGPLYTVWFYFLYRVRSTWGTLMDRSVDKVRWLFTIFPKVDFFTGWWMRTIIVLTFSPSGENVNTNMALIHRQVKKRNIPFYIKNDMGPNDSLTDGRKSYDCDEKYHIQNWQEGALFSFTLRWKIVVSLVTFHHLVNI